MILGFLGIENANETTPIAFGDWDSSVRIGEVKKGVVRNTRRDAGDYIKRLNLIFTAAATYGSFKYEGGKYIQNNRSIGNFEKMTKLSKNAKLSKLKASALKKVGYFGIGVQAYYTYKDVQADGQIQTPS